MVGRVRETVEVVKKAGPDAPLNYNGKIWQVWNYHPSWATHTRPRIYVAANQPQMMKMSAQVADNIMVGDPLPQRFSSTMAMLDGFLAEDSSVVPGGNRRSLEELRNLLVHHLLAAFNVGWRTAIESCWA